MINRKEFLKLMGTLASGMLLSEIPFSGISDFSSSPILFDLHCHPGVFSLRGHERYAGDQGVVETVGEMNEAGLSGTFFSLIADLPLLEITDKGVQYSTRFKKGEAWKEYKRQINILKELMPSIYASFASKASQLISNKNSGKVSAYFACEGGDFIEELDMLDEAYEDGLRSVQMVHYVPNHLGDLQTAGSEHDGLSDMGKKVVKRMNKLGMVVDVAHASEKTVKDIIDITDRPIILSHSILKMDEKRPIEARAISVEHAKLVAKTGGVIGAWPSGFNYSFDEFVDNTLRLADVVGIDHVGLGTDMDANFKPVLDSYALLPKWVEALEKKGLSNEEVQKIAGGNAYRVLKSVLKA